MPTAAEDFVLTVVDVFNLTGRGVVVMGPIESGTLHTGDEVEIWEDDHLVMTAIAGVELVCRRPPIPGEVGLRLGHVDITKLRPGQIVKRALDQSEPERGT